MPTMRILALLVLAGAVLTAPVPVLADRDHDHARRAVEEGKVLPLRRILDTVEAQFGGSVLEVELDRDDGQWLYEVKLLAPDGRIIEVELNAATAEVLKAKGAGLGRRGRH
ncbi:PepSY domain-containing protein [Azospirillum sp. TSO22-1]|uniref:PepSY domain-containing protein n=1 Tax=Azospirillum sp. TSO22-1 TaxID=716789 RepID=UPI000D61F18D|nr:PepSY domain-containing protein [Azospirillum sp. TSO22-1]PWC54164.1 hypothetical protein TSO221_08940 [Azospirillum sp. TSO22-1]